MFAISTVAILLMAVLSFLGVFEFGTVYTWIVLLVGLVVTISPRILLRVLPDHVMRYYMLLLLAAFIGVLGTSNHIGIYITYALVPIFSCLYFDPKFITKISLFSYIVMAISVYVSTADKYEVIYLGDSRIQIFIAYLLGFTIEYVVVYMVLYFLVNRAKRMMEERNSAQEETHMKTEFLSSMSHEIRTPMNAIIGMADVALRKDMDEDLRRCITIIRTSSMGLLEIVNDILDLSKIEAGKINIITEAYATRSLVDEVKAVVNARNIDGSVPIYYHIREDLPPFLEGDAVRIKQVIFNLASNAIKYTERGRIDITLDWEKRSEEAGNLICRVQDTGQGIREADMQRLFEEYSQFHTRENHGKEGTGIGLTISKRYVEGMNGTIRAESRYGEGSEFSFTIPQRIIVGEAVIGRSESKKQPAQPATYFTTKGARVLLVDDNAINREVLKAMLEPLELQIDEAENGRMAVNMAKTAVYDLIFMDSHMPIMNGEEATRYIRRMTGGINQKVPIIAITADAIAGVRERLLESGMDDYVAKPVQTEEICNTVRKYLPQDKIREAEE